MILRMVPLLLSRRLKSAIPIYLSEKALLGASELNNRSCRKKKMTEHLSSILLLKRGRSLMFGDLKEQLKNFLIVLRRKRGVFNTVVAVVKVKAFIARSQDEHLKSIDLESSYWAKSLFKRIGFAYRTCTTSKLQIPELAKRKASFLFHHQTADLVERSSIPLSLIININQTPFKYAPVVNQTLLPKGSNMSQLKVYHSRVNNSYFWNHLCNEIFNNAAYL